MYQTLLKRLLLSMVLVMLPLKDFHTLMFPYGQTLKLGEEIYHHSKENPLPFLKDNTY